MSFFEAEQIKKGYVHLLKSSQRSIVLAVSRCLIPDRNNMRVMLDVRRFSDELKLMKYYTNIQENRSLLSCIAPIAFTNTDVNEMIIQCAKAFKILTGSEADIIQQLSILVILSELKDTDAKQSLIDFDMDLKDKSEIIEFQKAKIKTIIAIDKKDHIKEMLDNLYEKDGDLENDLMLYMDLKASMDPGSSFTDKDLDISERKMLEYMIDIRNFKIKRSTYEEHVNPLELIRHDKDETFYMPILGNISIMEKNLDSSILNIKVKAKSGIYDFKFIKG